jgi:hypothetical protein
MTLGDAPAAEILIDRGASRFPADPRLATRRGMVKAAVGKTAEARALLQGVVDLHPDDSLARRALNRIVGATR